MYLKDAFVDTTAPAVGFTGAEFPPAERSNHPHIPSTISAARTMSASIIIKLFIISYHAFLSIFYDKRSILQTLSQSR